MKMEMMCSVYEGLLTALFEAEEMRKHLDGVKSSYLKKHYDNMVEVLKETVNKLDEKLLENLELIGSSIIWLERDLGEEDIAVNVLKIFNIHEKFMEKKRLEFFRFCLEVLQVHQNKEWKYRDEFVERYEKIIEKKVFLDLNAFERKMKELIQPLI